MRVAYTSIWWVSIRNVCLILWQDSAPKENQTSKISEEKRDLVDEVYPRRLRVGPSGSVSALTPPGWDRMPDSLRPPAGLGWPHKRLPKQSTRGGLPTSLEIRSGL